MKKEGNKTNSKSVEIENKFQLLLTLITLLKNTRHKNKKTELEFLMVNQTFNLIPYKNCAYWEYYKNKVIIRNASGLVQIDPDGPYTQWLARVIKNFVEKQKTHLLKQENTKKEKKDSFSKLFTITSDYCNENDRADWDKWVTQNAFILVMRNSYDDITGGLWIDREEDIKTLEQALLEDLGDGYAHALQNFNHKNNRPQSFKFFTFLNISNLKTKLFFMALILIMFIPVRMSATAPAEIVANKPDNISIPFDGVIDTIVVSPGQTVNAGDVLAYMDSTLLENKVTMTLGQLQAAEISLLKTERESMKDRSKLAEISILKAQVSQKKAEANFASEMLKLAVIKAERDGVVIFSDVNSLNGKPVQTGEQIMQLADLNDNELLIRMPISAMIKINKDIPARFFLNVNPFNSEEILYESIGYQATTDAGGLMSYKIRGKFINKSNDFRIGWTGTGKVYGEPTFLGVNLLRRPITTLRCKLGI